ncbi:MAG: threonine synthase [Deltaproteobacteria bacterium]|nr:threonine synthase [Deltaproteobacteria bacterium]
MNYYSTTTKSFHASLSQAVLAGLATDGGLYMPEQIPQCSAELIKALPKLSFLETAIEVAKVYFKSDIDAKTIEQLCSAAFTFPAPLVNIHDRNNVLELFHGPTLAFKDFGARFMAQLMSYLLRNESQELHILVATSGDTGSAVAYGFLGVPGIRVSILYPSSKVSEIQEKQLTTLSQNIQALEVQGTFDDCQRLVKQAFVDPELKGKCNLGSANSINIARLIPQSFYYFHAVGQINSTCPLAICVPSGNFGNLCAGMFAKKMGLPIAHFVAATNANSVIPEYLESGKYQPRPSVSTLSNAMDVGNPSNYVRIMEIYNHDLEALRKDLTGIITTDDETRSTISSVHNTYGYTLDPHGAVGYLALKKFLAKHQDHQGIFFETAHPAKFLDIVQEQINTPVEIPPRLKECLSKEKRALLLPAEYPALKSYLQK